MTRLSTLLALALLSASIGAAQPAPDFRVEGTVLDAESGQPVSGAHIQIGGGPVCWARQEASLSTSDDGAFQTPLRAVGPYAVCIYRDGYITEYSLSLTQCSPCNATFRIHAEAKVNGRVLSAETKEPIERMEVEAIRVNDSFDIASSATVADVRSFPNGQFSLEHLPPGQYFFRFTPPNSTPLLINERHLHAFAIQWWPGGDSARGATPFTVAAGTRFRMPDIWIPAVPRFQISGAIAATFCQAGAAYNVTIGERRGASTALLRSMLIRCGAEYNFSDLAPGRYQISLLPKDGDNALAQQDTVVIDRDLRKDFPEVHATP